MEDERTQTVHVTFGWSIADTIRAALKSLGRSERVIGLPQTLSVGPIDPPDPYLRQAWAKTVLRADGTLREQLDRNPVEVQHAWSDATALGNSPVFWVCFNSPMEHACFLAFADRMQGRTFDIIDATKLHFTTVSGVKSPCSLGLMRVQDIIASNLYAVRRPLSVRERYAASEAWSKLRSENAPFRIVKEGRLVSAPITHYDPILIEYASQDWEIAAKLIGRVVTKLSFDNAPPGQGVSDIVLFSRILVLAEAGILQIQGSGPGMRDYLFRKMPSRRIL